MTKKIILLLSLLSSISHTAMAQNNKILANNIASLSVMAGKNWLGMPVTSLGGEPIRINFDELSHDYHRYTYRIEHCDADWTPSEGLFASDYIQGFYDDNTIDDYQQSLSTYQLFTHYSLTIPNDKLRLTMSGNYRLTVLDDNNDDKPVLVACFMICENTAGIKFRVITDTDADINGRHQQLNMEVSYGNLDVTAPQEQLHTVVLQNHRWDNAVYNPRSQFTMRDGLRWEHCRELIFLAGNEYHKFETLDPTHTTMGLASVGWDDVNSQWHAYVEPDYPQKNYTYDVDANGSFLIRNSDNTDNATMSDYILTHFELHAPRQKGPVYLSGVWTNGELTPQYEMKWNDEMQVYENTVMLKQGYYSYRYLVLNSDGTLSSISSEGNFFETENRYDVLLYFRAPGDRADRLVGYSHN